MSQTTPCHNDKYIKYYGSLRLESLIILNKIDNDIMSKTTPCHDDKNIKNNGLLRLESLNDPNKLKNIMAEKYQSSSSQHLIFCLRFLLIEVSMIQTFFTINIFEEIHFSSS